MTTLFQVTIKPEVNGKELTSITFSSTHSFERCYEKITNYLKRISEPDDKRVYEILHTSLQTFKD